MKGSKKANLIVILIIATAAFILSLTLANLTVHEDSDSYKLTAIKNDSFQPAYINKVPTIKPKNTTNSTNETHTNKTLPTNKTSEKTNKTSEKNEED